MSTINPYGAGLQIGSEVDVVLTNPNSEPIPASQLIDPTKKHVNESYPRASDNYIRVYKDMVRLFNQDSHCRGWGIDFVWWNLKFLVMELKKQAFLSYIPSIDFDGKVVVAGGHLRFSVVDNGVYSTRNQGVISDATFGTGEANKRLIQNLDLILGTLSVMFDQRPTAVERRKVYGVGKAKHFRSTKKHLTYQVPTNWWLFHSSLAHLMYGAARMAYYITINGYSQKIWKSLKHEQVAEAINANDFEACKAIWDTFKNRFSNIGHPSDSNPFLSQLYRTIDFLLEYGIGTLGSGIYTNWRMKRKRTNYHGHLADLPSWEHGIKNRIFTNKHELYKEWKKKVGSS